MKSLSKNECELLAIFIGAPKIIPSLRYVAQKLGKSKSTTNYYYKKLQKKGYIEHLEGHSFILKEKLAIGTNV